MVAGGARSAPSASAIYEGFKAQRNELKNQLDELQSTRREISSQLEGIAAGSPERTALEARLKDVDARTSAVDQMLAGNAAQIAQAAAIPGAVVEPPPTIIQGPPEDAYVLGGLFMLIVFLPLSVALARRIWRRSARPSSRHSRGSLPSDFPGWSRLWRRQRWKLSGSEKASAFSPASSRKEEERGQWGLEQRSRSRGNRPSPRSDCPSSA